MVGIVLVSHSRALALSVQELVRSMSGPDLPLAIAAGTGDDRKELGTDAVEISEAIMSLHGPDGVLVLMDMGSAILSAETALDFLDETARKNIRFCAAPFVEGAVAAGVTANLGASLEEVCAEALLALKQKEAALVPAQSPLEQKPVPVGETVGGAIKQSETLRLTIHNEHGLHARPAARLITASKAFRSNITVRNLSNQRGPVSIKSLSSLASLEILKDNEIELSADGDDSAMALKNIRELIEGGLGDDLPTLETKARASKPPGKAVSVPISGGIAIGKPTRLEAARIEVPQHSTNDIALEIERLHTAIAAVQKALESRRTEMSGKVGAHAEIYEAQITALHDPDLVETAAKLIREDQANAAKAWETANRQVIKRYESLLDPYLRERAADLEDVGRQVLELLVGKKASLPDLKEEQVILIADNLTPNQVSNLDPDLVRGVVLLDGGPTAHSSILLRAMGIPAIVQARAASAGVDFQRLTRLAMDGGTGKIWIDPDDTFLKELQDRQMIERKTMAEELKASQLPVATADGRAIHIFANIGDVADVEAALNRGAEGVGLLRTEFLFLDRKSAPTEDEQYESLVKIAGQMGDRPVIVRTLDVGGDKELPYLPMPAEENPFLGVRAIRLCLLNEALFTTQLRAILRAAHGHNVQIMFPMIATVTDLENVKAFLEKVHQQLEKEKVPHLWPIKTGIMIEIPSAALLAENLAEHADFFSIGTNDLTQYTLAADRGNPELAVYQDALHPAVLRLIDMVVKGAGKHNRPVAVCGEAAADDRAAEIFIGLGVQELSLTSSKIPRIKAHLRKQTLADLQKRAEAALQSSTAAEVRAARAESVKS